MAAATPSFSHACKRSECKYPEVSYILKESGYLETDRNPEINKTIYEDNRRNGLRTDQDGDSRVLRIVVRASGKNARG